MTIEIPQPQSGKHANTEIIVKEYLNNETAVFDFRYFQRNSIRCDDFHNYCENRQVALSQIADFFYTLQHLSQHKFKELDQARGLKEQLHWHRINNDKPLRRIDRILRDGYHLPDGTIAHFENEYIEFSCTNGQRVICIVRDNVIMPLFMDPNHLVCQEGSSRNVKQKQQWSFPSLLCEADAWQEMTNSEDGEARKMILDGIKAGEYQSLEDVQEIIRVFDL